MSRYVSYHEKNHIGTITISRPERFNALGPSIALELKKILSTLFPSLKSAKNQVPPHSTPNPRCLILRAKPVVSPKLKETICIAGGDLKELSKLDKRAAQKYVRDFAQICLWLEKLPVPVITVADGTCIGGGIELFLAGDIRLCTKNSAFHFRQLEVGLPTGYGSTQRMLKLLGHSRTQFLLYTSSRVTSEDSLRMGLTHFLCIDQKNLKNSLEFHSQRLLTLSWEALNCQKRFVNLANKNFSYNDIVWETEEFAKVWLNNRHKGFVSAYNKK